MHVLPLLLSLFFLPAISSALEDDQIVMSAGLGRPDYTPLITPQPTLADLLTIEPSASIFYSYARELELSSILSEPSAKVSLFVPTNKAIMALSRKPWVLLDALASCWWINGYALWMQTSRARRNWWHWNHGGAMRYICEEERGTVDICSYNSGPSLLSLLSPRHLLTLKSGVPSFFRSTGSSDPPPI